MLKDAGGEVNQVLNMFEMLARCGWRETPGQRGVSVRSSHFVLRPKIHLLSAWEKSIGGCMKKQGGWEREAGGGRRGVVILPDAALKLPSFSSLGLSSPSPEGRVSWPTSRQSWRKGRGEAGIKKGGGHRPCDLSDLSYKLAQLPLKPHIWYSKCACL